MTESAITRVILGLVLVLAAILGGVPGWSAAPG